MLEFVEDLKQELSELLQNIDLDQDRLSRAGRSVEVVRSCLYRLQEYVGGRPFSSKSEEIHYFKKLAPSFYARLFYHRKEYHIELEKQYGSRERTESILNYELEVTVKFYEYHQDFYKYHFSQDTGMDEQIFIRDRSENTMHDEVEVIMGRDFCVGCYWTARLLANEQLTEYLKKELDLLRQHSEELIWTDSVTDAVELIHGLFLKKSFNHGKAALKAIVAFFENHLGINLKNHPLAWQEIKRRKKEATKYVGDMQNRLKQDIEE